MPMAKAIKVVRVVQEGNMVTMVLIIIVGGGYGGKGGKAGVGQGGGGAGGDGGQGECNEQYCGGLFCAGNEDGHNGGGGSGGGGAGGTYGGAGGTGGIGAYGCGYTAEGIPGGMFVMQGLQKVFMEQQQEKILRGVRVVEVLEVEVVHGTMEAQEEVAEMVAE